MTCCWKPSPPCPVCSPLDSSCCSVRLPEPTACCAWCVPSGWIEVPANMGHEHTKITSTLPLVGWLGLEVRGAVTSAYHALPETVAVGDGGGSSESGSTSAKNCGAMAASSRILLAALSDNRRACRQKAPSCTWRSNVRSEVQRPRRRRAGTSLFCSQCSVAPSPQRPCRVSRSERSAQHCAKCWDGWWIHTVCELSAGARCTRAAGKRRPKTLGGPWVQLDVAGGDEELSPPVVSSSG